MTRILALIPVSMIAPLLAALGGMSAVWAQAQDGASVKFSLGEKADTSGAAAEAGGSSVMTVVVTGVGLDPDRAKENAFANALEQAVGVLVDAQTIVQNDQIVQDKVLTVSRGFVQEFAPMRQWQENGLHYVRARATVSTDKLVATLDSANVAIRPVAGELLALRALHSYDREEQAAEMLRGLMRDWAIDTLLKVQVVGQPEVTEQDALKAKLVIRIRFVPDMTKWEVMQGQLVQLLKTIATEEDAFSTVLQETPQEVDSLGVKIWGWATDPDDVWYRQVSEKHCAMFVLVRRNPLWSKLHYRVFVVPRDMVAPAIGETRQRVSQLRIQLVDAGANTVQEDVVDVGCVLGETLPLLYSRGNPPTFMREGYPRLYALGPLFWHGGVPCLVSPEAGHEHTIDVTLDKLRQVDSIQVALERKPQQ